MITVEHAKKLLMQNVTVLKSSLVKIEDAVGFVLAENVLAKIDLPPFNQSAMDGYGISPTLTLPKGEEKNNFFKIIGEIKAGDFSNLKVKKGEAIRIFTGAALPDGADSIIVQEKVKVDSDKIILNGFIPKVGDNIRYKGSQIKIGETALKKGKVLNPAAIGFLASLGYNAVKVYRKPIVSIIVTGNELVNVHTPSPLGRVGAGLAKVYESNSVMLASALKQLNIETKNVSRVADEKSKLKNLIKKYFAQSDIVVLSGGISVGKYDLVKDVLAALEVNEIFYKVAQKPGKPLFVGKKNQTLIFALPGNSAATLTCFYEYVFPTINKMLGFENYFLPKIKLPLAQGISVNKDRANFLKGKISNGKVTALDGQESYILKSFAEADCLLYLPKGKTKLKKGDEIETHILPKT